MQKHKKRAYIHIHLDEQTQSNIQGMRADREKLGISRWEMAKRTGINYSSLADYEEGRYAPTLKRYMILAEFFGWDIKNSPNYKFAKTPPSVLQEELKRRKNLYGLTKYELSEAAKFSTNAVVNAMYIPKERTLNTFAAIMGVFDEEERRSTLVQELTHSKK